MSKYKKFNLQPKLKRISSHIYIKSLILDKIGNPIEIDCGLIGQIDSLRTCGIELDLFKFKIMEANPFFCRSSWNRESAFVLAI